MRSRARWDWDRRECVSGERGGLEQGDLGERKTVSSFYGGDEEEEKEDGPFVVLCKKKKKSSKLYIYSACSQHLSQCHSSQAPSRRSRSNIHCGYYTLMKYHSSWSDQMFISITKNNTQEPETLNTGKSHSLPKHKMNTQNPCHQHVTAHKYGKDFLSDPPPHLE